MDRYESIEHYAAVKRRIYSHCRNVVVNHDDKATWPEADADASSLEAVAEHASANRLAFSLDDSADVDYRLQSAANDSWLCHRSERVVACNQLQVPGNHNIANALAVLALLEPFALDQNALAAAITGFTGLEHRTEFVRELNGVRWYNDSKGTNIDACEKAIEAMQAPVVLIAGGLGKGADFTSLSDVVKEHVKLLVLIGEDAALIADALANTSKIEMAVSLAEAVSLCADFADAGDAVLLSPACASFDMFENFEQRGVAFKRAVEALAA